MINTARPALNLIYMYSQNFMEKWFLNMIKNIFPVNQESATWQSGVEVNQA